MQNAAALDSISLHITHVSPDRVLADVPIYKCPPTVAMEEQPLQLAFPRPPQPENLSGEASNIQQSSPQQVPEVLIVQQADRSAGSAPKRGKEHANTPSKPQLSLHNSRSKTTEKIRMM